MNRKNTITQALSLINILEKSLSFHRLQRQTCGLHFQEITHYIKTRKSYEGNTSRK